MSGRAAICSLVMTVPTVESDVLSGGGVASTVTVSAIAPISSVASTLRTSPMLSTTPRRTNVSKAVEPDGELVLADPQRRRSGIARAHQ